MVAYTRSGSTWSAGQENIHIRGASTKLQREHENKPKQKEDKKKERNNNTKHMQEKDRRRALDRETLAYCASHPIPSPDRNHVPKYIVVVVVVFITLLTDPLRIQPWSQDIRNQTKSNRESEVSRESRQKRTDKRVASKGHRRDKIENTNKSTQTVETT